MVFSSPIFLTIFLPAVLLGVLIAPRRLKNLVLLLASLGFYWWGAAADTVVLFWVVAVSFIGTRFAANKGWSAVTIAGVLAPLLWYKYSAFFAEIGASLIGSDSSPLDSRVLPVGISFFTFQALSYVIDVRRGTAEPLRRPDQHLLYISLFPQLIAGPIVRYSEIQTQLLERVITADGLAAGATRFAHGLGKKVIVADSVAPIADAAFATGDLRTTVVAWVGLLAYTVQIYFDFSGYSDMAIGLGMMFGFTFPENFARPYSSRSITEFWRRWHITLSSWFRDYVYIPLGGSRSGHAATYRNLLIVFFLTALWHGAAFTFLVWGGIHGLWLVFERVTGLGSAQRLPMLRRGLTLFVVVVAWVFFRAPSLTDAGHYVTDLFNPSFGGSMNPDFVAAATYPNLLMLAVGIASFFLPTDKIVGPWLGRMRSDGTASVDLAPQLARFGYVLGVVPACMALIAVNDFSPFLYFQF